VKIMSVDDEEKVVALERLAESPIEDDGSEMPPGTSMPPSVPPPVSEPPEGGEVN
jgi:hypothetical protein